MQAFEFKTPTTVKLDKLNPRTERHGEALVPAIDMKCTWQTNNRSLDLLHPELRSALCSALPDGQKTPDDQGELGLAISELPFIKFTKLHYPLRLDLEFSGYTTRVDHGLGDASDLVIGVCVLKNFCVTPLDGGSVEIEFTIQSAADIDERISGKLAMKQQQNIVITLLKPNEVQGDMIDASAGSGAPGTGPAAEPDPKPKKSSKAMRDATDAFVDAHTTPQ